MLCMQCESFLNRCTYFLGFTLLVIQKFQPKFLFTLCQIITAISTGAISLYNYLQTVDDFQDNIKNISWIPLVSIITIVIMRMGTYSVMYTLLNELYPTEIRTESIALTETICLAIGATSLKLYPDLKNLLYDQGVFLIYAVMGLICALWGAFTMPDNRGKSLVKVEELYE